MAPPNATIRDVARLSGVSPMTVSRVINESERVSPDTRRRVEAAIAELGYVPSRLARGLSRQRTGTIVPDVANPFFTLIVRAAEEVARRADYRVILCDTRADLTVERDVIGEMIAHRVEGLVIAPVSDRSSGHLRRLGRFGLPFVLIDRTVVGVEADAVLGDSVGGARELVEHLVSLGHRRIGLVVESDEVSTARDRRAGLAGAGRGSSMCRRNWPVCDAATSMTCSGVPSATTVPPPAPPSGPMSMIQSAVLITSRLCSMTMTVLPLSASEWSTPSSLLTSSKCRPVVGSSRT